MTALHSLSWLALQTSSGAPTPGSSASLRLLDLPALWVVVLVVLPLLAIVAWIGYAREDFSVRQRVVLAALRFSSLAMLCGVALATEVAAVSTMRYPCPCRNLDRELNKGGLISCGVTG